jgi:FkbM family methyltransferase
VEALMNGRSFEVAAEPADFWGWVSEGRYDREWQILSNNLTPEHTFLDLGAWVGSHSLYASRIAGRVVAVEPDPIAYGILTRNVELAEAPIEAFQVAITGHAGIVTLGSGLLGASTTRQNPLAGGGIGAWESGQTFEVPCQTLRGFVERLKLEDPLFIKMDVEGSEEEILEDVEFFRERQPILYLEQHPWWWKDEKTLQGRISEIARAATIVG